MNPHPHSENAHAPRGFFVWMRNKLLAGLFLTLPLAATFFILRFFYDLLHGLSEPLLRFLVDLSNEMAGRTLFSTEDANFKLATGFIGVLIPLLALVALGIMATNVIGVRIVAFFDRLLLTIPFVSFIYKSLRQVIDSFKTLGSGGNFKRVAYIDYPVPGLRMLAFVTGQFTDPRSGKAMTTVFMPTAPNPTTGILLVVDSDKVTDAEMSLEEAMKMIFSGGLIVPENARPLNKRPADTADSPLPPPPTETFDPESDPEAPPLPIGLPRAEDFDSGDPDILASADDDAPSSHRRRGISRVLPWKRTR
ncbi:MAG: DUF502 domain-containing protein [Verrucomicrobiales bacterium]|nr:DUF502 domain-containing protein [Verrucomicrobiales bacterium]